ncbi:hypothetical protein VTH82DRAFT_7124 [Thermothelomyces myriococcoides]
MDEGDIPKEVPREEDFAGEPENIIRGHKATISNPQTSDRAKENSRKVLESYGEPYDASQASHGTTEQGDKDPGNVARGLKASISNPGVSEGAKKAAREKLDQLGA